MYAFRQIVRKGVGIWKMFPTPLSLTIVTLEKPSSVKNRFQKVHI